MSIAFVIVATNKYIEFVPPLMESINTYFLPDADRDFYVFTDQLNYPLGDKAYKAYLAANRSFIDCYMF